MKIKTAEIVMSAVKPEQYPEGDLPEIAMVGRSNVGKSSAINTLLGRKKLARVSSSPGKTRTINFYLINNAFYLVDLPGYGYAKTSKPERAAWGKMIETYLSTRENLQEVIQLVDIRHNPSQDDQLMYNWLKHFGYGSLVLATKLDKIKRSQYQKHIKNIREILEMPPESKVMALSALKKTGVEDAWEKMGSLVERPEPKEETQQEVTDGTQ
ncbi:ribosome biogenesis GTP-binding protein YihA/YsxC [Isachenkonia alkalipeptolytica]|uniref:Probable GTP-binding protein EngB n=1 Tax=Isachenkonia alkalipeptolytica TaxID=2565777 RepID=A0AA43XIH0_9CLOT|nr:ribosome biogenesis GTP-binding protein YihA/YsxC [Isachenkonia alkalipeptolytica]NBG87428.1 YihA family ribosome biogenesis GTP-binding protein [Isachenkonia alkalipeptolytica]